MRENVITGACCVHMGDEKLDAEFWLVNLKKKKRRLRKPRHRLEDSIKIVLRT
jgi:hypothetical protein